AAHGFAECTTVRIVVDEGRLLGPLSQPIAERKICPTGNLMRAADVSRAPIGRPSVADAHRGNVVGAQKPGQRQLDLRANPFGAPFRIHVVTPALNNIRAHVARKELQLGAANFDGEKSPRAALHSSLKYS